MLGSWEIAYIDHTHRKLSETGLRCSGTILEGGVLFIDQKATIGSCSCSRVKRQCHIPSAPNAHINGVHHTAALV